MGKPSAFSIVECQRKSKRSAKGRRLRWAVFTVRESRPCFGTRSPKVVGFSCISHPKSLFFTIFPPSSQRIGDLLRSSECGLLSPLSTPRSSSYDDHPRRQATLRLGLPGRQSFAANHQGSVRRTPRWQAAQLAPRMPGARAATITRCTCSGGSIRVAGRPAAHHHRSCARRAAPQ